MAAVNTLATMNSFFKIVYDDYYRDRVPNFALLQADIPFAAGKRIGQKFVSPICLGMEHGVVYAASGAGAFSLSTVPSVAAPIVDAEIVGSQIVLKARIDYEAAQSAVRAGKQAFANSTATMVKNMWKSVRKRVELEMLYGQVGLGQVSTVNITTGVVDMIPNKWADAIWAGMEGARVVCMTGSTTHSTVTGILRTVDLTNKKLTISAASVAGVTRGDIVLFSTQKASSTWASCKGLFNLLNSPTRVFGITCASYSLWNPVTHTNAGLATNTTFAEIQKALAKGVAKGIDNDVVCYVNPTVWELMSTKETTYRVYDSSYTKTKYETGAKELRFHSQTGTITVKPHPFVWEYYGIIIDPMNWKRIGATDVTFSRAPMPGVQRGEDFFIELESAAGYELRCYSHQAPFTDALGKSIFMIKMNT